MILSHRPLKGALFGSAFLPGDELETLARVSGSNMALFYRSYEVILASPALQMIWPEGKLGSNIARFREFMEEAVAPAERMHLGEFFKGMEAEGGVASDVFLLKAGLLKETGLLGLIVFNFSWGRFLVVVPGEAPGQVREVLASLSGAPLEPVRTALDRWVEDSEIEFVLTGLFERFPNEFRGNSGFFREAGVSVPENQTQIFDISYVYRNQRWQRDVLEGELVAGSPNGTMVWKRPGSFGKESSGLPPVFRERGVRVGNEVLIRFSVFLGGVLPLGDIPVPVRALTNGGLLRMNRFIREISMELVPRAQPLTSDHFRFCRYWTESGFSVRGLEEIARIIDQANWRNLMVLPFWETGQDSLAEVKGACRVSDPFFVDPAKNMGLLLLRDCSEWHARNVVVRHFRNRVSALVESPVSVGRFLSGE